MGRPRPYSRHLRICFRRQHCLRFRSLSLSRLCAHRPTHVCISTRAKAPSYGRYHCYCGQRHPCSCSCGLHKRAPRAQGRSRLRAAQGLRSASRRLRSALLFRKPARPPRTPPPTSRPTAAPGPSCSTLRVPAAQSPSAAPAARERSASAPLQARSAVFPRAPQAPLRGLAPQGREGREGRGPSTPTRSRRTLPHPRALPRGWQERRAATASCCRTPLAPSRLI